MTAYRPALAPDPRRFGRRIVLHADAAPANASPTISNDVRLFATTFAAGFLFVTLMLA
ncbi:hypothetical protein G7077_03780 [Sphingomonas piscis]|uniref:Uncharacterized protein n=1 Tax=Sphingomonas piscis TaxID=2714943 RepID=A0A6G7YN48_9SPHN|nr:hypothetical protein [Sphingomonas piscis]QIK78162.1 hypothetical protein G7077_03780 [Sphingomonas piscis]